MRRAAAHEIGRPLRFRFTPPLLDKPNTSFRMRLLQEAVSAALGVGTMLGFLKFTGGRRRGSVTLAALLAYLGATIGVPVPGSVEKDHSQRYP
jgi:hypothetical protein